MAEKLIKTQNLYSILDPEPYFLLCALLLLAWLFYKLFLKDVSDERHLNLRGHFKNIFHHFLVFSTFFSVYILISQSFPESGLGRALPYLGVMTLGWGMIVFVKTCRLIILQYLFLGSMKAGVPVLIVNIFSLILSILLALWSGNQIFGFQVAPLLATSAAFSIILGLAIQDTLGNLFAGISLQVDKSFEIGDWLEVVTGTQKTVGQVKEISWRATMLIGLSDEKITIPNRALASALISNFSTGDQPIVRSQVFKLKYGVDIEHAKQCLIESTKEVKSILTYPEPLALISESNESWISIKLVYFIENYGSQYAIADQVMNSALKYLIANGIEISPSRLEIIHQSSSPPTRGLTR
jgi:small-conductance mechanosensitive channel